MNHTFKIVINWSIAFAMTGGVLLSNETLLLNPQASVISSAEARVGRPLTPMSYAGVARRTTRRAVAVGAGAYGAAVVVAPVVVAPAPYAVCRQVVDAYGRIVTVC
jgi:hypothetical protein